MAEDNSLAKRPSKIEPFRAILEASRRSIEAVLPKHLTADRMMKVALVAISKTPKLMECYPPTVATAVVTAAQLGLDCGGVLGSAYLVPYQNRQKNRLDCQLVIGYKGLIDLARRSGEIETIEAHIVYEQDEFDIEFGLSPKLIHRPNFDTPDRGAPKLVYAVARFKGGAGYQVEVMTVPEVEKIRRSSKAANGGPWVDNWGQMARKTVIRRLMNYLPLSPELMTALEADAPADRASMMGLDIPTADIETEVVDDGQPTAAPQPEATPKTRRLTEKVRKAAEPAPAPSSPPPAILMGEVVTPDVPKATDEDRSLFDDTDEEEP